MMASHYFSPGMTSLNIDTWTAAVQVVPEEMLGRMLEAGCKLEKKNSCKLLCLFCF
ncbi:hypothetical protein PAHAL_3G418800 [Panicum hallii]|uniref:Uncharacterized protein n=1 Tax=Panicum hallii TaxID=206008 RepID=A0A2T8KL02_9POAL|nr:hypothetical protein PAHAL_3G418800 [Panicum hallii]